MFYTTRSLKTVSNLLPFKQIEIPLNQEVPSTRYMLFAIIIIFSHVKLIKSLSTQAPYIDWFHSLYRKDHELRTVLLSLQPRSNFEPTLHHCLQVKLAINSHKVFQALSSNICRRLIKFEWWKYVDLAHRINRSGSNLLQLLALSSS